MTLNSDNTTTANPWKTAKPKSTGTLVIKKICVAQEKVNGGKRYELDTNQVPQKIIHVDPRKEPQLYDAMVAIIPAIADMAFNDVAKRTITLRDYWRVSYKTDRRVIGDNPRDVMIATKIDVMPSKRTDLPEWIKTEEELLALTFDFHCGQAWLDNLLGLPRSSWESREWAEAKVNAAQKASAEAAGTKQLRPVETAKPEENEADKFFGKKPAKRPVINPDNWTHDTTKRNKFYAELRDKGWNKYGIPGPEKSKHIHTALGVNSLHETTLSADVALVKILVYLDKLFGGQQPVTISEQGEDDLLNEIVADDLGDYSRDDELTTPVHWSTVTENMQTIKKNLENEAALLGIAPSNILLEALATLQQIEGPAVDDWKKYPGKGGDALFIIKANWKKRIEEKIAQQAAVDDETQSTQPTTPATQEKASQPPAVSSEPPQEIEIVDPPSRALATVDHSTGEIVQFDARRALDMIKAKVALVNAIHNEILIKDIDYGEIPGTGKSKDTEAKKRKDVLLKAGAEKLLMGFDFYPVFKGTDQTISDWRTGLFQYEYECTIYNRATGRVEGTGIGSCNSMESKYHWREAKRICPHCNQSTIIKGKDEYGGGWLCFKKQGGCGATFKDGDKTIESQQIGRIENPDIFDLVNTMSKMAQKRALVAATLNATGASAVFTQDLEDFKDFGMLDNAA